MRWIKGLTTAVICLVVLFIGIFISVYNTEKVSIDLVFFSLPELNLSFWLVIMFIVGGVAGLLVNIVTVTTLRARLRAEKRRVSNANKELDKLRTNGLKEVV